jgi:hypothetical protein
MCLPILVMVMFSSIMSLLISCMNALSVNENWMLSSFQLLLYLDLSVPLSSEFCLMSLGAPMPRAYIYSWLLVYSFFLCLAYTNIVMLFEVILKFCYLSQSY